MLDQLPCLGTRGGKAQPEHDVVETTLEQDQQVLTGVALLPTSDAEVVLELALEHAVDALDLLLLTKLDVEFGELCLQDMCAFHGGQFLR